MSALNTNVLSQARESYMRQLKLYLTPLILEGLVSLFEDSKKIEEDTGEYGGNYLKQFQKLLTLVQHWNQSILEEETRRIITEVDFLMQIVTAVFVAHVQILATVKVCGKDSKITVKIPTSDIFIHAIYCKCAEAFYYNPFVFDNYHLHENKEYIKNIININVDDTIDDMTPVESIIKEYISNSFTSYIKESPTKQAENTEDSNSGVVLGLDNVNDSSSHFGNFEDETPLNDDFGTGKGNYFGDTLNAGKKADEDFNYDFDAGKDDEEGSKFDFKDDETDIFSGGKNNSSPFGDVINDAKDNDDNPFKSIDNDNDNDPFKTSGPDDNDPFKSSVDDNDPFKSNNNDDNDPFKSSNNDDNDDPFKSGNNDDPFKINLDEMPNIPI